MKYGMHEVHEFASRKRILVTLKPWLYNCEYIDLQATTSRCN